MRFAFHQQFYLLADLCVYSRRVRPGGGFGATILWEAAYTDMSDPCAADCFSCGQFECDPPPSTACTFEYPELTQYQDVGCDVPIDEALVMGGLPPTPPPMTDGPHAGWEPQWRAHCCCQDRPPSP